MKALRSDIQFTDDDSHRYLPSLIGVMVFLAVVLLSFAISIHGWIIERNSNYHQSFTITLPATVDNKAQAIRDIESKVKGLKGVQSIVQMPDTQLQKTLEPWLGSTDSIENLPLPTLITVNFSDPKDAAFIDYKALEKILSSIVSGVEVDAQTQWVSGFANFSYFVQAMLYAVACIIFASMAVLIAYTSRASLHLHGATVDLLHNIGAEDQYIATQFQRELFYLVLPGAAIGSIAAAIMYGIVTIVVASLDLAVLPSLNLSLTHIVLWLFFPFLSASGAWGITAYSVRHQLRARL